MQKQSQTATSQPIYQETRNHFGDVLSLLVASQFHHHWKLHQVKRVFNPPLYHGQFRIWYSNSHPLGFCCWAWVSDEILELLQKENYKMQPKDWQSGKNLWLAEFIAPNGSTREIVKNMRRFILNQYGENIKGHWFRPSKNKQGYAMSGKKAA